MRIILGISGAGGTLYGFRLLEKLRRNPQVEVHLVLTRSAERTAHLELDMTAAQFKALAHFSYPVEDVGSRLASGSFVTDGMAIAPCSIPSMSAKAAGLSSNLLLRADDVCLKERRKLVLMVRKTPLHLGHLRTMLALTEMGAVIAPPVPGFYHQPQTVLDLMNLPSPDARHWDERTTGPKVEPGADRL